MNIQFRKLLSAVLALLVCALSAAAQNALKSSDEGADQAAIRENVRQMEAGWNTKSGALFAKPFAANADYVVVNGIHIQGHDEIEKGHQRIFDTIFKDSTCALSVKQIRLLRPDIAVVHVSGHFSFRQGDQTNETDVIFTLVMAKEKGDWKISAFQNTRIEATISGKRR